MEYEGSGKAMAGLVEKTCSSSFHSDYQRGLGATLASKDPDQLRIRDKGGEKALTKICRITMYFPSVERFVCHEHAELAALLLVSKRRRQGR